MNVQLLTISIGYGISILITLGLGIFVLFTNANRTTRVTFFLMAVAVAVFEISLIFGVHTADPILARKIFMFNLTDIFIVIFNAHWILSAIGKAQERKRDLGLIYGAGILLFLFFLFNPEAFIRMPRPKLYFKNYFVAGDYYILMVGFFFVVVSYFYYQLIRVYRSADDAMRNRIKYFLATLTVGYGLGSTAFFLVFDIPFDPILSMFTGFYTIPLSYGIVKYQLMDIRVAIRKAALYSILVAMVTAGIVGVSFLNTFFVRAIPGFQIWFVPLIAGTAAVIVGNLFWRKSKEADRLKYEFITIAAHKLRTPLTRIKWIADILLEKVQTEDEKRLIEDIHKADNRLVELADVLLETTKQEGDVFPHMREAIDFAPLVRAVLGEVGQEAEKKHIRIETDVQSGLPLIQADVQRIRSALRVFLDNAILYTPAGGTVNVSLVRHNAALIFSVTDTGIGISKEDLPYIFEKFFRTHRAALIDTEGSGLGLFIARSIVEKHGGAVGVESMGEGKGTRFWFSLPIAP